MASLPGNKLRLRAPGAPSSIFGSFVRELGRNYGILLAKELVVGKRRTRRERLLMLVLRGAAQFYLPWRSRGGAKALFARTTPDLPALYSVAARRMPRSVQEIGREGFFAHTRTATPDLLPQVTISVVTYNSERWIGPWFDSLLKLTYPLDKLNLVFRDHSRGRGTLEAIEARLAGDGGAFASTQVFQAENVGFGSGHDTILRASHDRYVLVTNVDLEFHPGALHELVEAALGGDPRSASWEARQTPFEHPKFYDPYTLDTAWCSHACVLLDREKARKVGGYDRSIFMYGEDVDLSFRLRSRGFLLKYVPTAVVVHHTYASAEESKPLQVRGSLISSTKIKLKFATLREAARHAAELRSLRGHPDAVLRQAARESFNLMVRDSWRWPLNRLRYARIQFFGFDYEMTRSGAFHVSETRPAALSDQPKPLVSVIVRTHGDRLELARGAVTSILNQTYRPIEILLCEDGGQIIGRTIAAELKPHPGVDFRAIALSPGGRSRAANAGLRSAHGAYVCFLDDDDALFADHLETLTGALANNPAVGAAYTRSFEVDFVRRAGRLFDKRYSVSAREANIYSRETLLRFNLFPIQAVLFQRALLAKTGLINEQLDLLEDWNFWCRLSMFTDFLAVNKTTSLYRVPGDDHERAQRADALNRAYDPVRLANLAFRDDELHKMAS